MADQQTIPPNAERAEWAAEALDTFAQRTMHRSIHELVYEDQFCAVADLLCDLHHWCDRHQVDFYAALANANMHYECETVEYAS